MFCTNCGASLTEGMKFCPNCGHAVLDVVPSNTEEENSSETTEVAAPNQQDNAEPDENTQPQESTDAPADDTSAPQTANSESDRKQEVPSPAQSTENKASSKHNPEDKKKFLPLCIALLVAAAGLVVIFAVLSTPSAKSIEIKNQFPDTMHAGESIDVSSPAEIVTVTPQNASIRSLTWETSDSSVISVDGSKIAAKAPGTATITAKLSNGVNASRTINVDSPATAIEVPALSVTLKVGETYKIVPEITPANSTDVPVYTSNGAVSVDTEGNVYANEKGSGSVIVFVNSDVSEKIYFTVLRPKMSGIAPVSVVSVRYQVDYVGGVDFSFNMKNNTDKSIKYIDFSYEVYNSVGDPVIDQITGKSTVDLRYTGPVAAGAKTGPFHPIYKFYNSSATGLHITSMTLTYMDGSIDTYDDEQLHDEFSGF